MGDRVRIGLLGASRIAPPAVIAPAGSVDRVEIVAVAARDLGRAEAYAGQHGIPVALGSYEELIADDRIDAVYNALPASAHAPWTIAALEAGKHVLSEKPFCLNAAEARAMVDAATAADRVLIEAYHWRYHPFAARVREVLDSGRIGTITSFEGTFSVPIADVTDIRHDLALGGGAFMDLGCYPLHMSRFVFGSEPTVLSATAVEGNPGIDLSLSAELAYDGVPARVSCDMSPGASVDMWFHVTGTDGELHASNPIQPALGNALRITDASGTSTESVPGAATYHYQLEAFVAAVLDGTPAPTGGDDAIATMVAMDAIYAAAGLPPRGA